MWSSVLSGALWAASLGGFGGFFVCFFSSWLVCSGLRRLRINFRWGHGKFSKGPSRWRRRNHLSGNICPISEALESEGLPASSPGSPHSPLSPSRQEADVFPCLSPQQRHRLSGELDKQSGPRSCGGSGAGGGWRPQSTGASVHEAQKSVSELYSFP